MKIRNTSPFFFSVLALSFFALINSCKKTNDNLPKNPYDDIVRDDTTSYGIPLDSLTVTYVHKRIFATRCALPGCHDGHFEPDFRTPQSSFSTLAYASIVKNNTAATFKFRVIPFDTTHSVLYERITNCCFINSNDRMPQDDIGIPLPDSSINLIASWIMNGSRDMFGKVPKLPNKEPTIGAYLAFDTFSIVPFALPTLRYDTVRLDGIYYNPFIVPLNKSTFVFAALLEDDSTQLANMQYNKLKISTKADDFSSAWQYTTSVFSYQGTTFWYTSVPASTLPANDTLFMRYYVNDGSHTANTEFPRTDMLFPYKTFWSFIRQ